MFQRADGVFHVGVFGYFRAGIEVLGRDIVNKFRVKR